MREIPLSESAAARELADRMTRGEIDIVIFLTGVGTRMLIEAVAPVLPPERFASALSAIVTIARGPKPRAVLAELGVRPTIVVPEPNTWRELLDAIDARGPVSGRTVAVQEYGTENPELIRGLTDRGANVLRVPIYRWALPEDLGPLRAAIADLLAGRIDVALFTSATQVDHLFRVAGEAQREQLQAALGHVVVASIGPICTDALAAHGVRADLEPAHPKMGHLVLGASERAAAMLRDKREAPR